MSYSNSPSPHYILATSILHYNSTNLTLFRKIPFNRRNPPGVFRHTGLLLYFNGYPL